MELGNLLFGHSRGKYQVSRDNWENKFAELLDTYELEYHGCVANKRLYRHSDTVLINDRGGIRTKKFEINPYYWGFDDTEIYIPNFIYFPKDYHISWYKYPLRDAYTNQDITFEEFCEIIDDCKEV